jgi:hypothetical protein
VKAATAVAGKVATTGVVSAKVAILMEGMIKAMFLNKLKILAVVALVLCFLGTGAAGLALRAKAADQPSPKQSANGPQAPQPEDERQRLEKDLREVRAELKTIRADIYKLKEQLRKAQADPKGGPADKEGKDKLVLIVYPVGDLVPIDEAHELVQVITKTIEPKNWTQNGASIHYFYKSQSLVISQSAAVHERVQSLLDALRKAKPEHQQPTR